MDYTEHTSIVYYITYKKLKEKGVDDMKKVYERPVMVCDKFVADEYVAACWWIQCNVETGFGFLDKNGNGKYDAFSDDVRLTDYMVSGCDEKHVNVELDQEPTANAMWQPARIENLQELLNGNAYPVYWWSTGEGSNNQHFSKASDAQWDTNPNAS